MLPTGPDPEIRSSAPAPPPGVDPERFEAAIVAIDEANAADPNMLVVDGVARPKELAHAEAMTGWVLRLDPEADEAQLLAARAHHFRRWTYPRSAEPEGRSAYLRWRTEAKRRQATAVAELLTSNGYDDQLIERVRALVAKEGLGRGGLAAVDGRLPAAQIHEDALCLVFLTTQFDPVANQLGEAKMIEVLARTLAKMSDRGRAEAFALPLDDRAAALVVEAMERVEVTTEVPETAEPAGLDLLLATPVDALAEDEAHDDPDLMDAAPVILVNPSPETHPDDAPAIFSPGSPVAIESSSFDHDRSASDESAVHDEPSSIFPVPSEHVEPAPDDIAPEGDQPLPRRASSVRRAMLWGERSHPPAVSAPPPPLPLEAPAGVTPLDGGSGGEPRTVGARLDAPTPASSPGDVVPTPPVATPEPSRSRRWFGRGSGDKAPDVTASPPVAAPPPAAEALVVDDTMPMSEPVEFAVPAEPDIGAGPVDPWGLEVVVARLSAGARRAGAVALGIASTMLVEGEVVEAAVQGEYQHHPAVVVLTSRRILIVNERHWSPDVRAVTIGADVVVQGWQDDRRATLVFGDQGRGLVVSGIVDRPLARDLARRVRELVASFGGPPA